MNNSLKSCIDISKRSLNCICLLDMKLPLVYFPTGDFIFQNAYLEKVNTSKNIKELYYIAINTKRNCMLLKPNAIPV